MPCATKYLAPDSDVDFRWLDKATNLARQVWHRDRDPAESPLLELKLQGLGQLERGDQVAAAATLDAYLVGLGIPSGLTDVEHGALGELYFEKPNYEDAARHLDVAVRLQHNDRYSNPMKKRKWLRLQGEAENAIREQVRSNLDRARCNSDLGLADEHATKLLSEYLQHFPRDPEALSLLGDCLERLCRRLVVDGKSFGWPHCGQQGNLGEVHVTQLSNCEDLARHLHEMVRLERNAELKKKWLRVLGNAEHALREKALNSDLGDEHATKLLSEYLQHFPRDPEALSLLGDCLERLCRRLVVDGKSFEWPHCGQQGNLGEVHVTQLSNCEDLARHLHEMVRLERNAELKKKWLRVLGDAEHALREKASGKLDFAREKLHRDKNPELAAILAEQYLQYFSDDDEALSLLADCLEKLGRCSEAKKARAAAADLLPVASEMELRERTQAKLCSALKGSDSAALKRAIHHGRELKVAEELLLKGYQALPQVEAREKLRQASRGNDARALQEALQRAEEGNVSDSNALVAAYTALHDMKETAGRPILALGPDELRIGLQVQLKGLQDKPELDGWKGVLKGFDHSRFRWVVQLETGKHVACRAQNLERKVDPEATSIPAGPGCRSAFFSLRFDGEPTCKMARRIAGMLKERNYLVHIVQAGPAKDFGLKVTEYLDDVREKGGYVVAVCTEHYGEKTSSQYSTFEELKYADSWGIQVLPLKMAAAYPPRPQDRTARALVHKVFQPSRAYLDCVGKSELWIASEIAKALHRQK